VILRKAKLIVTETGKPLYVEFAGTFLIACAIVTVFLADYSSLFLMLAPVFAGSGTWLWEQSDRLLITQEDRREAILRNLGELDDD
jgi:hypothetical protein